MKKQRHENKMEDCTYLNKDMVRSQLKNRLEECLAIDFGIDTTLDLDGDLAEYANSNTRFRSGLSMRQKMQKEIVEINKALDNLNKDSYGICEDCGRPIPMKRLLAIPTANLCVQCKQEREG